MSVNLSCGNCKTIRSFSGQPPTCDECGWVAAGLIKRPDENEPNQFGKIRKQPPKSAGGTTWTGLLFIPLLIIGYFYAQNAGYISRSRTMDVAMKSSWIVGEYKVCYMPLPATGTEPQSRKILSCDDAADVHALNVEFFGDPDAKSKWNCRRVEDSEDKTTSLSCKSQ